MQMRDATAKDIAAIVLLHMEGWRSAYRNIIDPDFLSGRSNATAS
jgi:hypothetical protein